MVFQAPVLFEWRSVEENVRLPLELMGLDRREREARAAEMLALVELGDFARHHPHQLSGGMQQRVAIARALALQPSILLMDEPFGALDEMTRERMNSEVLRIWEQTGITVVFVTHSIPEAVFLSSRVVVMSARPGRITRTIDVDLPRPRNDLSREEPRYFELVTEVREALRAGRGAPGAGTASNERLAAEGGSADAGPMSTARRRLATYLPAILVFVVGVGLWESADPAARGARLHPARRRRPSSPRWSTTGRPGAGRSCRPRWRRCSRRRAASSSVPWPASQWRSLSLAGERVSDAILPVAVAANAIPIIAFAPIFNNWFGVLNPLSKMMIAAMLVFFPVMINVTRGLSQVEPSALELMRSYAASEWTVLRKVRIPNALPFFLTALKVATTLALIGAVVGEYFGGSSTVLGRVVVADPPRHSASTSRGRPSSWRPSRGWPPTSRWPRWNGCSSRGTRRSAGSSQGDRARLKWAPVAAPTAYNPPNWKRGHLVPRAPGRGEVSMKASRIWLGAASAGLLILSACTGTGSSSTASSSASGGGGELTPVSLQLQWAPQAQFAGYFAAVEQGYYEAQGLDVEIIDGGPDVIPQQVGSAEDGPEFTISWVPKVLEARESGSDLVDIAQIFQRSGTLSVSWADSDISGAGRLRRQEGRGLGLRQRVRGHRRRVRSGARGGQRLREGHPAIRHDPAPQP